MFHVALKDTKGSYYAVATKYIGRENGKTIYKIIYLHHIIKSLPKCKEKHMTDHLNHITLDNRKVNLENKLIKDNLINREGANRRSTSGIRHVNLDGNGGWMVQFWNGKTNITYGKFEYEEIDKAKILAEEITYKYYPEQIMT